MTGLGSGAAGIDPERVAEMIVTPSSTGPDRRGSGYRISESVVLTAAHVVRDAAGVRARFDADRSGEWVAEGKVAWSDPEVDVAVVAIIPRPQDKGRVEAVGFGRVAERDAVLECSAMGFPLFKLRDDPAPVEGGTPSRYRDSVHAVGTIAVLSNRREGTLEVSVPAPDRDPDPRWSPWGGMSGAAVWSAGRVIGVVAEHHRSDGLGRLAATRVDRWYERLSPTRLRELRDLTGLPATADGLREVVPPTDSELVEAGYLAQVRDLAPEELRGREQELAELVRFCAGDEPYLWWRAEPWAGKSALAAWFVVHPPAGIRVVSFFVTRRLAGQADSTAFTEALVEQLAVVADESMSTTPSGRDRERILLLDLAARRVGERQERLLLVVDGLDEDEGEWAAGGKLSIASLLPRRPAANVRVLVTSRPYPGIPGDVPGDHPLRRCVPRPLEPSPFARDIELAATKELMRQLNGGEVQERILGYIAASGGGLTLTDLAELTGSSQWKLEGMLGTVFGRSLMTLTQRGPLPAGPDDVVYAFAHETLSAVAQEKLGNDLRGYRQRIDGWADGYRERGWPAETPLYLLWPYGKVLGDKHKGDLDRLVDLATDPRRHDRLLAATLGDGDAIAEVAAAQQLALGKATPNLATLGRLAVHRDRLESRNENLPVELPGLLVRLGQRRRGEAIAKGMPSHRQPKAFAGVAAALADAARWERAENTAREITETDSKARALAAVGRAMMESDRERALGLLEEAGQVARSVPETHLRPFALAAVAEAFADAGLWDHAEQTAQAIDPLFAAAGARALQSVVDAHAAAGRWDRAEQAAEAVPSIWEKAAAIASLAGAVIHHDHDRAVALLDRAEGLARGYYPGVDDAEPLRVILATVMEIDRERALRLAADLEQAAQRIPHPTGKDSALVAIAAALAGLQHWEEADRVTATITSPSHLDDASRTLAEALARAGQWERAEQEARGISSPRGRAESLIAVATTAQLAHEPARALVMATDAEQIARGIPHADRFWALQAVARAQAAAGQLELAERAARDLSPPDFALQAVAEAQAAAGQWDRAEQTARDIAEPDDRAAALTAAARSMAGAGQWDRAEGAIRDITGQDPLAQVEALGRLAEALVGTDPARAAALAAVARRIAHGIADGDERNKAAGAVVKVLAATGQWEDAEEVARHIANPDGQREALTAVAKTIHTVDRPRALALAAEAEQDVRARMSAEPVSRAVGLGNLAKLLAEVDLERTLSLAAEAERAASVAPSYDRDDALAAVVEAHAALKQWDRAEEAARAVSYPVAQAQTLGPLVQSLVDAREWDRAARVAGAVPDLEAQVEALAALAGALVTVDPERALAVSAQAEDTIRTIPNLYDRATAWAMLVERLTAATALDPAADDPLHQRVRRLLAQVLAGERWLDALEPLGKLDPAALAAVDRELHG